ncbi:MAG: DedA family protein [Bdellovibrionota bacterium]
METLHNFIDLFLHLDVHLNSVIQTYGVQTYLILFAIIFCETGLVVTPILPGDSLLFAIGTFCASGSLDISKVIPLLCVAVICGDLTNYTIGRFLGPKVLTENGRIFKKKYLDKTQWYYERFGGKTIIVARFVPIVRTFAPFMAGVGGMSFPKFFSYSLGGGVLWISALTTAGYLFGNIPVVKNNFTLVVLAIVFVSLLPAIVEGLRARRVVEA